MCAVWIDLLDPTREELAAATPADLHPRAIELLHRESRHGDEPRPTLESHGDYVFGVFLVPKVEEDRSVVYREVDIVLTKDTLMTVRKSAGARRPSSARRSRRCTSTGSRSRSRA